MFKNSITLVFYFSLILCAPFCLHPQQIALLSKKITDYSGPQYTWGGHIYSYDYIEENGLLIISGMGKQSWDHDDNGEYYGQIYHYAAEHNVASDLFGTTYNYTFRDSSNTVSFRYNYTIDSQNRLTYCYTSPNYGTYEMRRFFGVSGSIDSLIYANYYNQVSYIKHIFTYDSLNRINVDRTYTSTDSLDWSLTSIRNIYYGGLYPCNLNFNLPETHEANLIGQLYNSEYQVDSLVTYYMPYGNHITFHYFNSVFANHFDVSFYFMPDYSLDCRFDYSGRLLAYATIDVLGIIYTWGEYVSCQDESISHVAMSVYPNPFSSDITIKTDNKSPIDDISIYNLKGQLIRSWKDVKAPELIWDGKDNNNHPVSSGVYLIRAKQGNSVQTVKAIRM